MTRWVTEAQALKETYPDAFRAEDSAPLLDASSSVAPLPVKNTRCCACLRGICGTKSCRCWKLHQCCTNCLPGTTNKCKNVLSVESEPIS